MVWLRKKWTGSTTDTPVQNLKKVIDMNKELLAKFIELAEKELSSVILTYKMELKVDNEYLLSLI